MFDCPARMKTLTGLVDAAATMAGCENRNAVRIAVTYFMVGSILRGLPGDDGNISRLQAFRRRDDDGWIQLRELSNLGWSQIVAILCPISVKLLHARLHGFALLV